MPAGHTNRPLQREHEGLPRAWSWMDRERLWVEVEKKQGLHYLHERNYSKHSF